MRKYQVRGGDTLWSIAQSEYGDGSLYTVISAANSLADPNVIDVGQQLALPYVTYRHRLTGLDTIAGRQQITQDRYGVPSQNTQLIWEITNGVAQSTIADGAWLQLPDLVDVGHHTVATNETLPILAQTWYGDEHLASIVQLANGLPDLTVSPGQVLLVPGLNRRTTVTGDTLRSVCTAHYGGQIQMWMDVVAAANRIADPDAIFSGQVLSMPS